MSKNALRLRGLRPNDALRLNESQSNRGSNQKDWLRSKGKSASKERRSSAHSYKSDNSEKPMRDSVRQKLSA